MCALLVPLRASLVCPAVVLVSQYACSTCRANDAKAVINDRITFVNTDVENLMTEKAARAPKLIAVSGRNLQNTAIRLLPKHNKLVSPEVDYLRRVLGEKATQREIEEKILQVPKLPWSEIVRE